jgi:uncharacterized protein (DUF608 family)
MLIVIRQAKVFVAMFGCLACISSGQGASAAQQLFRTDIEGRQWAQFEAEGYERPVCGVVHRLENKVTNGVALGGIDTGCVDLETSGLIGYCTIFNTLSPRRGPVNLPILGLAVGGETWVLCDKQPKEGTGRRGFQYPLETPITDLTLEGVKTAKQIHYWGHYPVADLEFETDAPVSVGVRAWSPFIPGDVENSIIPAAIFEVRLRNTSEQPHRGTIAFSFPGPTANEAGNKWFTRQQSEQAGLSTVMVSGADVSYAIGAINEGQTRFGGGLNASGPAWAAIASTLPDAKSDDPSASVAVDFELQPGQSRTIRFVLTWSAPTFKAGGYNFYKAEMDPKLDMFQETISPWYRAMESDLTVSMPDLTFYHMYDKYYPHPLHTARKLATEHQSLLDRIVAWQSVIYAEESLPVWLRDSLVNVLYIMAEDALWAQARPPLPAWVTDEDGLFGMNEGPRASPQIECLPCSFYGNMPIVYFFPKLALSTLRGYKGYQFPDGTPPWTFGTGRTGFYPPTKGYQWVSNGICIASMVHRFILCHGDESGELKKEFYPLVKSVMQWTMNLPEIDGDYTIGERVLAMPKEGPGATEWFEQEHFYGLSAHVGILHLAQLRISEQMAEDIGDHAFAQQCRDWLEAGQKALEEHLWTGSYYLNSLNPKTGEKSDVVMGYQMDGEWITDHHGLPSTLPEERIRKTLETIKRCNVANSASGAINYARPEGTAPNASGGYGSYSYFYAEVLMLAMNYMYEGEREFGLDLAGRAWENLVLKWGDAWNLPNYVIGSADTGEGQWPDYYQLMMLWSLPAALQGEDLASLLKDGGLVQRVIEAGRPGE